MKYPLLNDPIWLHEQYVENKNSTIKLAEMVGCSVRAVGPALAKFGIKARDPKESRALQHRESFKHEQLNDRDWVYQKYVVEKLSTQKIADLIDAVSGNSVRQALKRHGLEVKNKSEGQTRNRENDYFVFNKSVIEGCLLGDGSLDIWNRESDISIPYFHKKNIHYDHVKFVADKIFSQNSENRISYYAHPNGKNHHYHLTTKTHSELKSLYKDWYPSHNNFKKVIPENISIDANTLLHMFLDDGTSFQRRKESIKKQILINICSQCFTRDNQEMFCEKVRDKFGIRMKTYTCSGGYGYLIRVPQSQAPLFYEIIGPPPVPSLAYKWK